MLHIAGELGGNGAKKVDISVDTKPNKYQKYLYFQQFG